MKILLTGATGYIGKRLLPNLVENGHTVVCCVRDKARFSPPESLRKQIEVLEIDFLDEESLTKLPHDIEAAYYLMHSMSSADNYETLEQAVARNFREAVNQTEAKQVIYLSGMINEKALSRHLASRKKVEDLLSQGDYHLTTLRAGIIIGSGSASFEIIRDLVEKLPVMVAPRWLKTRCQPIGIRDVITLLTRSLGNPKTYGQNFDIGGPDILTYQQMLQQFAEERGLKRRIFTVPVMTPRLSSYWLYFVTSTSYKLAKALVNSMKVEVVARDNRLAEILSVEPLPYRQAIQRTLQKIEDNQIVSSWKDAWVSGRVNPKISEFLKVPTFGCFVDRRSSPIRDRRRSIEKLWQIGGEHGWYYANNLWKIRGLIDKFVGGVGLSRGRTIVNQLSAGDAIDFWRVLYADREEGRLLLYAEMKLPGEAWLEFNIKNGKLWQTATFRPKGFWGRVYWHAVSPFHNLIFNGLLKSLAT